MGHKSTIFLICSLSKEGFYSLPQQLTSQFTGRRTLDSLARTAYTCSCLKPSLASQEINNVMVLPARKKPGTAAEKATINHHNTGDENSGQEVQRGESCVWERAERHFSCFMLLLRRESLGSPSSTPNLGSATSSLCEPVQLFTIYAFVSTA